MKFPLARFSSNIWMSKPSTANQLVATVDKNNINLVTGQLLLSLLENNMRRGFWSLRCQLHAANKQFTKINCILAASDIVIPLYLVQRWQLRSTHSRYIKAVLFPILTKAQGTHYSTATNIQLPISHSSSSIHVSTIRCILWRSHPCRPNCYIHLTINKT